MRVASGVPGFDALVQGGLPNGSAVVLQGPAGKEKDTFLLQFVAEGLSKGGSALVVLSSLSPARYEQELRDHGVDVDLAFAENRLRFVDWFTYKEVAVQDVEQEGATFRASIDLANVGIAISRAVAALPREGDKRAAVEVLSPALSVYDLAAVYGFAQSTKAKLERFGVTSLFVVEKEMHDERTLSSLHQPFDGVVDIERVREGDALIRKVGVLSLKGTTPESKYVPIELGEDHRLRIGATSERERTLRKQEELIRSNPKDPKIWLATARNLKGMGEHERALKCVDAALNLDPKDADSVRLKADLLEALGRKEEADRLRSAPPRSAPVPPPAPPPVPKKDDAATRLLAVVEQRLHQDPRDADALFVKAAALAKMDDAAGAVAALETLALIDDAHPGLWVLKAKLHARRGEGEKARQARLRAQEVDKRLAALEAARKAPPTPEAEFECPECGSRVRESDASCPSCGVLFEGVDEPPRETEPPKPKPEIARRGLTNGLAREAPRGVGRTNGLVNGTRGRTNGLVNGTRGRTNGLVNGTRGRTNGLVNGTRGRTNGLVNGTRGRTNGLVNGTRGRTNGVTNGLVNGLRTLRSGMTNGLTNGSGFTNGLGSQRYSREIRRNRWKLFLIPAVFALLVATPLMSQDLTPPSGPQIDGRFDDWAGVARVAVGSGGTNTTNADLVSVAIVNGTERTALYVQVAGSAILAGGPAPTYITDTILVFVDRDDEPATGYVVHGLGADALLQIQGSQGTVQRATVYRFSAAVADRRDWRGWTDPAPIAAAANGNALEIAVGWLLVGAPSGNPVFLVAALAWNGATDFADLNLGASGGLVRAVEHHVQADTMGGANAPLLGIDLSAVDQPASVSGLSVDLLGTAPLSAITSLQLIDASGAPLATRIPVGREVSFAFPPVTLTPGSPQAWQVTASLSGGNGETLGARVPGHKAILAGPATVTLSTDSATEPLGYVGAIPSGPIVDGAFREWSDAPDGIGESTARGNAAVDLSGFAATVGPTNLTFHASLIGPAFAGTVLTTGPAGVGSGGPGAPDRDRDTVPDGPDLFPDDFNNDGTPDGQSGGDQDGDGYRDYTYGGNDTWLNTTIPGSFGAPYAGRVVSIYIGPVAAPPAIGEDRLRLFVDADNVSATGFYVAGIGADFLIEMRGREGAVDNATLRAHAGSPWEWNWTFASEVRHGVGTREVEAAADFSALVADPPMLLEVSDWRGASDTFGIGTRGTRSGVFTGPDPAFVPAEGTFAYRSTGTRLQAYARASRSAEEELVLRHGSLFLGWRTESLGGVPVDVAARTQAAGGSLVIPALAGASEEYTIAEDRVKHNVWLSSTPTSSANEFSIDGTLRLPEGAVVYVDGSPTSGPFSTNESIRVEFDGFAVRLQTPYAFESRKTSERVGGSFAGTIGNGSVRLSMRIPSAWLSDPMRSYPIVLDPTGIIDTSTASTPTGGPHQRNVFHDGTNFWAFFYDGTTIQYEPSADGLSWVNAKTTAFTTGGEQKVSVWYHDAATDIVYIAGDTGGGSTVQVRRGTISGTTITWGTEASVTLSGQVTAKSPFITRDANGFIWVASNSKESGNAYNFAAARSTNADDVSAWNARTTLLTASISGNFIQGEIVPLGSGDVYALWYADGVVDGKKNTGGTWGSLENIDTTTAGVLTKAPSATVDGSFNIHLVYADSAGAIKYRQRTSSWQGATTLDSNSGNTYPTITRETSSGDLYAFWIDSTNQIKGQRYTGSWSAITLETNTKSKTALTSLYSAGSQANVGWAWSQGSATPWDVKFAVYSTSLTSRTIDTSTDSSAVSYNHQRKVFSDGAGHRWVFYYDGANTVYTWSDLDSVTWENTVSQAFTTSGVDNPSVWFHDTGSTKIVYAVGDGSTNDLTLNVRRGTISGTTITWGTETTITAGANALASKVAFITRDTNGYLWVASNAKVSGTTFQVVGIRSTNIDDASAWNSGTNLLSASISNNFIYPTMVPLTGGDVYALWYADGAIDGKKNTGGTWGSLESIATTTAGVATKIPSAVVDGSGNIDLVYIDSTGTVQHKQRTSSWGSADTVDSGTGNTSPTVTRESSTGTLYAFYLQSTSQIKGRKYSGSWSDVTGIDTSTTTKAYITSPYTVDAAWKVNWVWDQGGSSPYEIKIARVPEFGDLVAPIATVMIALLLVRRARRLRRRAPA